MAALTNWWKTVFDKKYLDTYIDTHPPELTARQVKFLTRELKLKKSQEILDLACGFGRHAIPLAQMGHKITGVDYSRSLLSVAKKEAKTRHVGVNFIRKDMRDLGFKNKFNVIYCMFSSFGYFRKQADADKTLKNIARGLKKNGLFLIDLSNTAEVLERVEKNYRLRADETLTKTFINELSNDLKTKIVSTFNPKEMTMTMKVNWLDEDENSKSYETCVRLYTMDEIRNMLRNAGLRIVKVFGDFDSSSFKASSPRMIVIAKKNAA